MTHPSKILTLARKLTHILQLGLILQIACRGGPIPWAELALPEGRTIKACQVMIDKEKSKIKKAREANGEDFEDTNAEKGSPKVWNFCLHRNERIT